MKEETYRKVFIKTEADLPKHENFIDKIIIFHEKYSDKTRHEEGYSSTWDDYFIREIDWYLQPVTAKTDQETNEHLPYVYKFSDRLDQIFEQGMPTKAQIIDAFNKFSGEKHLTKK